MIILLFIIISRFVFKTSNEKNGNDQVQIIYSDEVCIRESMENDI